VVKKIYSDFFAVLDLPSLMGQSAFVIYIRDKPGPPKAFCKEKDKQSEQAPPVPEYNRMPVLV
jgi:hypothetical protein